MKMVEYVSHSKIASLSSNEIDKFFIMHCMSVLQAKFFEKRQARIPTQAFEWTVALTCSFQISPEIIIAPRRDSLKLLKKLTKELL